MEDFCQFLDNLSRRGLANVMVSELRTVAPMSVSAWRMLATCLEEAEDGVVKAVFMDDDPVREGEKFSPLELD